ncbi:hypothetical protein D3C80_1707530 [compost metagenome]
MDEIMKKLEFLKFRYAELLQEDNLSEGIVYAGDLRFMVENLEYFCKEKGEL